MLDPKGIRKDFPILERKVHGHPLVYLDNAATSQKPQAVLDAMTEYYTRHNANVHRGIHTLGDEATRLYEASRAAVARFIGAKSAEELIFVRNTTEGINLVAYTWGEREITQGDVVVVSEMEHHSNLVPWQRLCERKHARLEYIRVVDGELDGEDVKRKLALRPKLVAFTHVSNFLGTINPIREIVQMVTDKTDAKILIDGAQAVPHMPVDVKSLGVDFYAFSGHKMLGPMGIGGLWVRREILKDLPPFLTGGGMISEVTTKGTTFADLPDRFDAGTPNVAGAVGLKAAVAYLERVGMDEVRRHEMALTEYLLAKLEKLSFVTLYGPREEKRGGLVAFTVKGVHAHDVTQVLDNEGIAVRSGHHCTMPAHTKLKLAATTRASVALYNTREEIDRLVEGLKKVKKVFGI